MDQSLPPQEWAIEFPQTSAVPAWQLRRPPPVPASTTLVNDPPQGPEPESPKGPATSIFGVRLPASPARPSPGLLLGAPVDEPGSPLVGGTNLFGVHALPASPHPGRKTSSPVAGPSGDPASPVATATTGPPLTPLPTPWGLNAPRAPPPTPVPVSEAQDFDDIEGDAWGSCWSLGPGSASARSRAPLGGAEPPGPLVLDLCACDYAGRGAPTWTNRVPGAPEARVPGSISFDGAERAFEFRAGGDPISVPGLAACPVALPSATYCVWARVPAAAPGTATGEDPAGLGWVLCGAGPGHAWGRAVTLNDPGSGLGRAPTGRWLHVVGVWERGAQTATAYLDGRRGGTWQQPGPRSLGRGPEDTRPSHGLQIGGRCTNDASHNTAVSISDVRVYGRALNEAEVQELFSLGRSTASPDAALPGPMPKTLTGTLAAQAPPVPKQRETGCSARREPRWEEATGRFWCATGVSAYDVPDGEDWQREFRGLAPAPAPRRKLRAHASDAPEPTRRSLIRNISDPSSREARAAHTAALQKMSRKPGVPLLVQGRRVALFRFGGRLFAVGALCPHQGGRLAEGEVGDIEDMVDGRTCYVTCPVHKFQFDLASGELLQGGPCKDSLPVYAARIGTADAGVSMEVEVGFVSLAEDHFVVDGDEDF